MTQRTQKRLVNFVRSRIRFALVGILGIACLPSASANDFGLGIMLGEPTGLTGKYFLGNNRAIDAGLAYSFGDYGMLFSDYLFHFPGAFGRKDKFIANLTPYVGIGAALYFGRDGKNSKGSAGIGIRIPLGLEWRPADPPIGVYLELAPGIGLVPGTFGFFQGGVGARFYFPAD